MNELTIPKKIACVIIAVVINFIMFSVGLVGDLSVVYIAMFLTVPTYAAMILIYPTFLYLVFPVAMSVLLYLATDNIVITLLGVMFLILSALCAEGVIQKRSKYNTIVRMSIVFFFAAIFLFVLTVFIIEGYFSREAIISFANKVLEEFNASIDLLGGNAADYSEIFIQLAVSIPACLLMLFSVLSYIACTFTRKIVSYFNCQHRLFNFDNNWEFEMPIETAYIYIISYGILFVASMFNDVPKSLEVTLYVVLYPLLFGMFVSGVKQIKFWLNQVRGNKFLIIVLLVVCSLIFYDFTITVSSFIGVYRCFNLNKSNNSTIKK